VVPPHPLPACVRPCDRAVQALNELVATEVSGLHFALMAVVDFCGRRMSVSSVLPIGGSTLCYGRCERV
jgi:hypothetical protein